MSNPFLSTKPRKPRRTAAQVRADEARERAEQRALAQLDTGKRILAVLAYAFRGLHHIDHTLIPLTMRAGATPEAPRVAVTCYAVARTFSGLASFDSDQLTRLILACHKYCVRAEIDPGARRCLRITLSARKRDSKSVFERHPDLGSLSQQAFDLASDD